MPRPDHRDRAPAGGHRRNTRVLVIDDRLEMAEMLADGLNDHGYDAVAIASSKQALARLAGTEIDAIVTDLRMPDVDGMQILAASQKTVPDRPVIMMTAFGAVETAVEAIRRGAYHYLTKPFKLDELVLFLGRALDEMRVRREAQALRTTLRERFSPDNLIGRSDPMRALLAMIVRLAAPLAPSLF